MKRIYKYPLAAEDLQTVIMPEGAEILTIQVQGATPCIWALVDIEQPEERRTFRTYGTGHQVVTNGTYRGTYQLLGGDIVFHVFEV